MVEQGNRKAFSTFSSLRRFAQEESEKAAKEAAQAAQEHCDLCKEPIPSEHRHLMEVSTREMMCACRPCSILFDSEAASEGRYRLIPDRHLCPGCGESMEGGSLKGAELSCSGCGRRYDVRRAGRCLDSPQLYLEPIPLLVGEGGMVKIALPSAVG